jgi:hypothetical protein
MKRFEQFEQGYKKNSRPGSHSKKPLDETKKHLGFQWDVPKK